VVERRRKPGKNTVLTLAEEDIVSHSEEATAPKDADAGSHSEGAIVKAQATEESKIDSSASPAQLCTPADPIRPGVARPQNDDMLPDVILKPTPEPSAAPDDITQRQVNPPLQCHSEAGPERT